MTEPETNDTFDARTVTDEGGAVCEDLYCLSCGYNLRGLYGDPIRCPECGHLNDLGAVALPAEMIKQALKRMETAPTLCVALAILFLVFTAIAWFAGPSMLVVSGVLAVSWLAARYWVRTRYDDRPGWGRVLIDFHLATLLCTLVIPLVIVLALLRRSFVRLSELQVLILAAVFWAPMLVWGLRMYFATRRRIAVMQRDAAVRIARKILERALHRVRR